MKPYPQYKDSGIEWLGEIPDHWEKIKLRYLFEIRKQIAGEIGYDILSITQQGIKIKDIKNMDGQISSDYSKYQYVKKGYFAMNHMDLLTGYVDISEYDGVTSPDYRVFSLSTTDYHDRYFLYLFQIGYKRKIFYAFGQGAAHFGRWRFPTEEFRAFEFPIPQIQEQTAIANFLDRKTTEIDSIITKKERLIELYEEEKAAVINHAVTKGLDPAAKMKDSGIEWLGEIPEHWEVKKLKHLVCKIGSGVTPKGGASVYQQSGIPLLRSQNIHFDGLRLDDVAYISDEIHNDMSGSKVLSCDVLLNITGASIGRCYFVDDKLGEANVNQHVCIIRPSKGFITKFIYFLLCSNIGQIQIDLEQTGGGREGLNFEALGLFVIPTGKKEEQAAIVQHIETKCSRIDAIISKFKRQIELLKEYRTALISEAVTGKIDVRENMHN